jgi:hypothetical protein
VALETLEHIPEDEVVKIIKDISTIKPRIFICSVPVELGPAIWIKNVASSIVGYSRHKEYKWIETFWAGLYRLNKIPAHDIHHKGFDWRWLERTIRHNMRILEIRRFPFSFLPAAVSSSIFIVSEPRP